MEAKDNPKYEDLNGINSDESGPKGIENGENPAAMDPSHVLNVLTTQLTKAHSNHCLSGVGKAIKYMGIGCVCAVGAMISSPVKGYYDGKKKYGIVGGAGFALLGTVVGSLLGGAILVGFGVTGIGCALSGLVKTPSALIAWLQWKDWDDEAQEWISYDLKTEMDKILNITDEQFQKIIDETGTVKSIFSPHANMEILLNSINGIKTDNNDTSVQSRPKKNVLDRELYDVLGVEPEATSSEIKKAYYLKARENHPDRNKDDPDANAKFQKIGQAYQVLGNEKLRMDYDSKGKSAVTDANKLDATVIYTMIFGSENFDSLIGELFIAMQIKLISKDNKKSSKILFLWQRKRVLNLAAQLVSKLDVFVDGDVAVFEEKAGNEVMELSTGNPLGSTLITLVGEIYKERAALMMGPIHYCNTRTVATARYAYDWLSTASYGINGLVGAVELRNIYVDAEKRSNEVKKSEEVQLENDPSAANKTSTASKKPDQSMEVLYGPNPTPEHKEKVNKKAKGLSKNLLGVMWEMTKSDIRITLKQVCNRVLKDRSVTSSTLKKRMEGLHLLGSIYGSAKGSDRQGLHDLLDRISTQTGIFGTTSHPETDQPVDEPDVNTPFDYKVDPLNTSSSTGRQINKTFLTNLMTTIDEMSVKELKHFITMLGGNYENCVEKSDLRSLLLALIHDKLKGIEE